MGFFDLFRPGKWLASIGDGGASAHTVAEDIAFDRNEPPLTRDLMLRFGGRGFIFTLRMWEAATRDGPACRFVPPGDHYRQRFEALAATGVALRGAAVPLEMRFRALPMADLRAAAKELGAGTIRNKGAGATAVAACPGAEAWLAARYPLQEFFLLVPEAWSYKRVEELWHVYSHEAREALAQAAPNDE
jgi:hypothetical protein